MPGRRYLCELPTPTALGSPCLHDLKSVISQLFPPVMGIEILLYASFGELQKGELLISEGLGNCPQMMDSIKCCF